MVMPPMMPPGPPMGPEMGPPAPMGGPPPGMPPEMMGGAPPIGPQAPMGGPPPPPQGDQNVPPPDFQDIILEQLRTLREKQGDDRAREVLAEFDDDMLAKLREWQMTDGYASEVLDDIMPPDDNGPGYPSWFVKPEKPDYNWATALAQYDWDLWAPVRERIKADLDLYHNELGAAYKDFDTDKDENYVDDSLAADCNAIISKIAGRELQWHFDALDAAHIQDAQKAEDAVNYWFEMANRRYCRSGHAGITRDAVRTMMLTGYACIRTGLDLGNNEVPFTLILADPATVVPTWDENGLARVTRTYQDTVHNVISAFDTGDGKVRKMLMGSRKEGKPRRLMDWITVKTYEDRWWRVVIADEQTIVGPVAHEYGFVPWVIGTMNLGEPLYLSGAVGSERGDGTLEQTPRIEYKHVSYFHFLKRAHFQLESIMSKMYTMWKYADKPAMLWYYDEFAKANGQPDVPNNGEIVPMQFGHEELKPAIESINPNLFGTLIQANVAAAQRSRLPTASLGGTDDANTSGQAIASMNDYGNHILKPIEQSIETCLTELGEMWLKMWKDWGHLYQGNTGRYGEMQVPFLSRRAWRDEDPAFLLVPEVIRRCGTLIQAKLSDINLANMPQLANTLLMLKQGGWMPNSKALTMLGFANPEDIIREIEYDMTRSDPEIQKLGRYERLREFNPEMAEEYREGTFRNQQNSQQQMPPPGMAGPPMGMDPMTSSMNLTGMGMGAQGPTGRPPDPMGGPPPPPPGSVVIPPGQQV